MSNCGNTRFNAGTAVDPEIGLGTLALRTLPLYNVHQTYRAAWRQMPI